MRTDRKKSRAASQTVFSGRDDILLGYLYAWRVDKSQEAHTALRRYCEYICNHGYLGFPSTVAEMLDAMNRGDAEVWISWTHAHYAPDDRALLRYIFGLQGLVL